MVGRSSVAATCAVLAVLASSANASAGGPPAQQGAFTGASSSFFGYLVAIDGDTAVVGAFNDAGGKGEAYVFVRSGTSWAPQATLSANTNGATDGAVGDQFGYTVAISGPLVLVDAPASRTAEGTVYAAERHVVEPPAGAHLLRRRRRRPLAAACFLSGTTAVVGAPDRSPAPREPPTSIPPAPPGVQQQELVGASGDYFGYSVAVSPDTTLVAAGAFGAASQAGRGLRLHPRSHGPRRRPRRC